ncbi:MAG: hypothetical protein FJ276_11010 [Planctomycetes bacterium]|nr:hypothetical protein [Planctomycetota bacterium]
MNRSLAGQLRLDSVAPGKLADLVMLAANPLDDIRHTQRIDWVIRGGHLRNAAELLAQATHVAVPRRCHPC